MKELIFNELSISMKAADQAEACSVVSRFFQTYKAASLHGFKGIRYEQSFDHIELATGFSLNDFCQMPQFRTYGSLLLGLARHPYIESDTEEEKRFISNYFYLLRDGEKIPVEGLGVVYLYQTVAISFAIEDYWHKNVVHNLYIEGDEDGEYPVISIADASHCECKEFSDFKEAYEPLELKLCETLPANKHIELRDDHGKDVLEAFAKRICKSPYVIKVINSLPFNPKERNFIHKVYDDGRIEIVLTDTEKGLGMVLQSTGSNHRETLTIAKMLADKYGR